MDIKNLLISKAKEIGVKVSPAQAEQFQIYLDLLLERNIVMNLTAITDPEEAVVKHFVDSLTLLKALEIKKNAKVIDVGTGAGFPGIPLIKMKGYFAAMKGPSLPDELEYARKAISSLGCDVVKTVPFILPDEEQSERFVAVMRKLRFTPKMYPRHGGTITKKPLFLEQKGEAK